MSTQPTSSRADSDLAATLPLTESPSDDTLGGRPAADAPLTTTDLPAPRTRWSAIIWGLVLVAIAGAGITVLGDPTRRAGLTDWFAGLTPASFTAVGLLTIGGLIVVTGAVGLIRSLQKHHE